MNIRMGNHPGKPLRPSYREHFRPLPPPQAPATDHVDAPLLSRTTSEALMASFDRVRSGSRDGLALKKWISAPLPSSAPEGEDLEGMGADRRTSMTISRMQSSSNSTGRAGGGAGSELEHGISRKSSADYASSCSSNARQKPKPIKMMTKEEKERITLERCNYFEKKHLKTTLEPFSIHSRAVSVEDSPFNPQKLRQTLAHIHEVSSADNDNKKKYENSQVDAMDICSGSAASDKQAHAPVPGSPAGALSEQHSHGHHKSRTQAQWAVTTEDPRLRSMIGREGLPRRMYMLRRDAIDYRTHSFAEGYFRLTRVGALEMTADEAGAHERNKDVSFVHLAQIQELISATEITLPDQPSTFHCFRLEFPSTKGNDKFYLTLAAFSPEERSKWLEALNLFTELTAAERERAAKRAAFKKQQKLNTKHHLMAQQLSLDKPDTATSPARPSSVGLAGAGGGPLPPRREGEALPAGATEGGDGGVGSAGRGGEGGGGRWFGEKEPAAGARQWTNGGMSQGAPGAASGPAAAAGAELPGAALKSPGVLTAVGGSFSLSGASDRVRPMSAVPWSTANASSPPTKYTKDAVRPTSALR